MKLHISDKQTVGGIQAKFNHYFPNLRLEFFYHSHKPHSSSSLADIVLPGASLAGIRNIHSEGDLPLKPDMKVRDLELQLEKDYDLHAQVFRRSRGVWLETTATDEKTLQEQSNMSHSMVLPAII